MDFANAAHLKTTTVNKTAATLINSQTTPARDLTYTDSQRERGGEAGGGIGVHAFPIQVQPPKRYIK